MSKKKIDFRPQRIRTLRKYANALPHNIAYRNLQYMTAKPIQTNGLLLEKNFDKNVTFKLI